MQSRSPFRYFASSPEVIRLMAMMYGKYRNSLRNVDDLLFERGIDGLGIGTERIAKHWHRC